MRQFKLSKDPQFAAKVRGLLGLAMMPCRATPLILTITISSLPSSSLRRMRSPPPNPRPYCSQRDIVGQNGAASIYGRALSGEADRLSLRRPFETHRLVCGMGILIVLICCTLDA